MQNTFARRCPAWNARIRAGRTMGAPMGEAISPQIPPPLEAAKRALNSAAPRAARLSPRPRRCIRARAMFLAGKARRLSPSRLRAPAACRSRTASPVKDRREAALRRPLQERTAKGTAAEAPEISELVL